MISIAIQPVAGCLQTAKRYGGALCDKNEHSELKKRALHTSNRAAVMLHPMPSKILVTKKLDPSNALSVIRRTEYQAYLMAYAGTVVQKYMRPAHCYLEF